MENYLLIIIKYPPFSDKLYNDIIAKQPITSMLSRQPENVFLQLLWQPLGINGCQNKTIKLTIMFP